jgi:GntR family transcriptional repressor for pyruvate dehydrogenase complex
VTKKVRDTLVRTILDRIFRGKLRAGDRLPSVGELARRHRMSAVSVREAVQKLSLMGLVRVRQSGGTFLSRNLPSIHDTLEARKYVEMATCLLAARNATEEERGELGSLVARMEDDLRRGDIAAYTRKDLAFHLAIGRMSGNALLSAFLQNVQEVLHYFQQRTHLMEGAVEQAHRFHRLIAEAIRQGDGGSAQILVTEHIDRVKRAWIAYERSVEKAEGEPLPAARRSRKPAGALPRKRAAAPKVNSAARKGKA